MAQALNREIRWKERPVGVPTEVTVQAALIASGTIQRVLVLLFGFLPEFNAFESSIRKRKVSVRRSARTAERLPNEDVGRPCLETCFAGGHRSFLEDPRSGTTLSRVE